MSMSDQIIKHAEERQRKEEALLEVPARVVEARDAVEVLVGRLEESAVKISDLQKRLVEANSLKSKMTGYFIGGVIGAVLGAIASKFI